LHKFFECDHTTREINSPNTFLLSQLALIQAKEDEDAENGVVQTAIINGQVMVAPGGGVGQIVPGTTAYGIPG